MKQLTNIQKDALTSYNKWSEADFKEVELAAGNVYKASILARQRGLLILETLNVESELFQWIISMILDGTDPECLEELLENRYFINCPEKIEKCIFYIYARASLLIQGGINDQLMQEFLVSVVPEAYHEKMRAFLNSYKDEIMGNTYQKTVKKAEEFFKNQDISMLNTEEQAVKNEFDAVFQDMRDASIQRVLRDAENHMVSAAVLYAKETARERILSNLTDRLRRCIEEDWNNMFDNYKQSIESMQEMLNICKKLQESGEIV